MRMLIITTDLNDPPELADFPPTLETYRQILNDGWLEGVGGPGFMAYIDEEGKIKNLPINHRATNLFRAAGGVLRPSDMLCGTAIFIGLKHGNPEDQPVPNSLIEKAQEIGILPDGDTDHP